MAVLKSTIVLGLLSALALAAPQKRSICHAGQNTINGQLYTTSCGLDRVGGDYGREGPVSWSQCQSDCAADSTCVTAQYHEDNQFCYFKNVVNGGQVSSGEDTIDLGSACQQDTTLTLNGLQCTISCGVDHHGGDYNGYYVGNYLACANACAGDANCKTAQYNEGNGYCYLKNTVNPAVSSTNTDSIICAR
jgi:hypothetical protein